MGDKQKRESRKRGTREGQKGRRGTGSSREQEPQALVAQQPVGSGACNVGYTASLLHCACHHCCDKALDNVLMEH